MKIFITGFMASGKTVLGKKLASLLQLSSFDLDQIIEESEKKTITEIFKTEGEEHFRNLETNYLKETINSHSSFVLSTGGGTILKDENFAVMQQAGLIIFLNTDPDIIYQRLMNERDKRPLMSDYSDEELKEKIHELLSHRLQTYHKADIICTESDLPELPQLIIKKQEELVGIGRTSG